MEQKMLNNTIDVTGQFPTIDGLHISQTTSALNNLKEIIDQFDTIIEIGYYRGGLTQWFAVNKHFGAKIIAYDISDQERLSQKFNFNKDIQFCVYNCFTEIAIKKINDEIETGGKVLVFCDGGAKNDEFNLFSQFLKPGDVIMLHDYFDSRANEPYAHNITWPCPYESTYSGISSAVSLYNLKEYKYEEFRKSLIGAFYKGC